jgi:DNA replication protein DnaC
MNLSNYIDGIEKKAADAIKAEQGDYYGDDGLLYCGKCGTKKQTRITIFGKERTPFCLCKCEVERRDREESERKRLEFEKRVKEYRRMGFPESDMQDWTFANDDGANEKISTVARNYFENFEKMHKDGKGLLLFGKTGTGKSFAAACIANALIDKGHPALVTNFARIRNTAQGLFDGRQEYFDSFNRFPLLILDDLAAESKSEYMQEIVYEVINTRYLAGLPLIVTTNLTAEELKHPADVTNQRTFSRLFEMCIPIEVTGTDRRRDALKEAHAEYKDILGY